MASEQELEPYWSLWRKLKAQSEYEPCANAVNELGSPLNDPVVEAIKREEQVRGAVLTLPRRGDPVVWNGESLVINNRTKKIKHDIHAVNTLNKLDNDDAYWNRVIYNT